MLVYIKDNTNNTSLLLIYFGIVSLSLTELFANQCSDFSRLPRRYQRDIDLRFSTRTLCVIPMRC